MLPWRSARQRVLGGQGSTCAQPQGWHMSRCVLPPFKTSMEGLLGEIYGRQCGVGEGSKHSVPCAMQRTVGPTPGEVNNEVTAPEGARRGPPQL